MSGMTSSILTSPLLQTPKVLINGYSSGSPSGNTIVAGPNTNGSQLTTLSGALSAGVLATMLTVTGPGVISFLAVSTVDATARTLRLQLTLDGVVAFDNTTASMSSANIGMVAVGTLAANSTAQNYAQEVPFAASCIIKVASNLTETDKVYWHIAYRTC